MRLIITTIICFVALMCASIVCAAPGDIASKLRIFSWTANTESDLAGYKIYHQKTFLVNVEDPTLTSYSYLVEDLIEGENIFNMTAYDTSGNESELSEDTIFGYDGITPVAPTGIIIKESRKSRVTIETWD